MWGYTLGSLEGLSVIYGQMWKYTSTFISHIYNLVNCT